METITCETCGKFNEGKEWGKSWICEDCKHSPSSSVTDWED